MMHGYDENIVHVVMELMGGMLDFAVYGLGYELEEFYTLFINSDVPCRIERGDSRTVMGTSTIELALKIAGKEDIDKRDVEEYYQHSISGRSSEYWVGWALSQYQWDSNLTFRQIDSFISINQIHNMYRKYHEMDIDHFVERMNIMKNEAWSESALKRFRKYAMLSQHALAEKTGIPLKTIQQYEQKQKDIRHAHAENVIKLAKALNCEPEELLQ